MTALPDVEREEVEPASASRNIVIRYFLAMAVPFAIDFATSVVYVVINGRLSVLAPMMAVSAAFLIVATGRGLVPDPADPPLHGRPSDLHGR